MQLPLDLRIIAPIGVFIALILKFTFFVKENRLIQAQENIVEEINNNKDNAKSVSKAQRILSNRSVKTREKNYINRKLSKCFADYHASDWIRSISGISVICIVFSVALICLVFIYTINESDFILNVILLSGQWTLAAIAVLVWFVHKDSLINPNNSYSFILLSSRYGLTAIVLGLLCAFVLRLLCAFTNLPMPILAKKVAICLVYLFITIPFIPIIITFLSSIKLFKTKSIRKVITIVLGLYVLLLGLLCTFTNLPMPTLSKKTTICLVYLFIAVPLIPNIIAFLSSRKLFKTKRKSYYNLRKAIDDHESGKLKIKLKRN